MIEGFEKVTSQSADVEGVEEVAVRTHAALAITEILWVVPTIDACPQDFVHFAPQGSVKLIGERRLTCGVLSVDGDPEATVFVAAPPSYAISNPSDDLFGGHVPPLART